MNPKEIYHVSGLGSFEFCAWAWYLDIIEGRQGKGNFFTCRGHGVHIARKRNLRQKIQSGEDLPLSEMQDAARDLVNKQIQSDRINLHCEQLDGLSKQTAAGLIIDTAIKMVEVDRAQLQKYIQPIEVEKESIITLEHWPFDIGLTRDCIDNQRHIRDCKTSRKKWTQTMADDAYQPSIYELGYRAEFNQPSAGFIFDCLVCTPKRHTISAYPLTTKRSEADMLAILERFFAMYKSIKAGIFVPAHQSSWKCSRQWCEFYDDCKFIGKQK